MRTEAVARMRDESTSYAQKNLENYHKTLDVETAKIDKDLEAIRSGHNLENSPQGKVIQQKRLAANQLKASAQGISDETLRVQVTAQKEQEAGIAVSFGLAFKDGDKTEYKAEAASVELVVGGQFITPRIESEKARADAVEAQIRNGAYDKKEERLTLVSSGRAAFEISAQSLRDGDVGKSQFALKVGTVLLDTAISVTPVLGWGKDIYEAALGKNLLTGEDLTSFERSMAVLGVLTAGIGSKLAIAGKAAILVGVVKRARGAEEAAELATIAVKADNIIDSAKSLGIKAGEKFKRLTEWMKKPLIPGEAGSIKWKPDLFVDLASSQKRIHILNGDLRGGGHMWPGKPGKSVFPETWDGDKIMHEVSDVVTDPNIEWKTNIVVQGKQRYKATGIRDGVEIDVIIEPEGVGIVTAFPQSGPGVIRNP
jgi:hypothetical protein